MVKKKVKKRAEETQEYRIHTIQSPSYRTIYADGARAHAKHGRVDLTLYSNGFPFPGHVTHHVKPDGRLGKRVDELTREGGIREVECRVIMSTDHAEEIAKAILLALKRERKRAEK